MRFAPILPVALVVLTGLTQQKAEAQEMSEMSEMAESIPLGKLGLNVADRLRRSIAIGPFVGAHATMGDSGEDGGLGVSFGVGLSTFGKARSPILDLFARADIPLGEKNGPVDISLGARFILDVL